MRVSNDFRSPVIPIMNKYTVGSWSPKRFYAYQKDDIDLESGSIRRPKRPKRSPSSPVRMLRSLADRVQYHYKLHPVLFCFISLSIGAAILIVLCLYDAPFRINYQKFDAGDYNYPFAKFMNLVMVAGHSVYTSSSCGNVDKEDSWFLESYQKNPGQAATFLGHIQKGVEYTARDDRALLLFSGGETRKEAGPRSEAQSYWLVADSKGWFGEEASVKWRALTEEHARDSFENLMFSICRFRELTGRYPQNITVVSYDFKERRFAQLHRSAIGFPESRFFYSGTPVSSSSSKSAAAKGEALVSAQFEEDPYGCIGPLSRKRQKRDPFHRSIPYPNGCPEIQGLFTYCGSTSYFGFLPWA